GDDVAAAVVDRGGDGIAVVHLRPEGAEHLERGAAQQRRVRGLEPAGDDLAEAGVGRVRGLPAARGEPAGGVLVGAAGRLHHAIEGEERVHGELHRFSWSVRGPRAWADGRRRVLYGSDSGAGTPWRPRTGPRMMWPCRPRLPRR